MSLSKKDKAFALEQITPINPRPIDIDKVLTNLLPLIKHNGYPVTGGRRNSKITTKDLANRICRDDPENFQNFSRHQQMIGDWLESDFLSLVHRGNPDKQQIASPLPFHINTYKLRTRYCVDYGVSNQVFSMLYYGAESVLKELNEFLSEGTDFHTDKYNETTELDLESLLILRLLDFQPQDEADYREEINPPVPLCLGQARILGDDISRLLAYQTSLPRLVLVDYIKNVIALHTGIYTLRLYHIINDFVENGTLRRGCNPSNCQIGASKGDLFNTCEFPVSFIADVGENYRSRMAEMAREAYQGHIEVMNRYIRSHFEIKKLHEFSQHIALLDDNFNEPDSLDEIIALRNIEDENELNTYFQARCQNLLETDDGDPDERLLAIRRMSSNNLEAYIEMIYLLRHKYHQSLNIRFLDSIFQKHTSNCLLKHGYGSINTRRYFIGSSLLETLLQIAVTEKGDDGIIRSRTLRIDNFFSWLISRYGIYIDRPPANYSAGVSENKAFRNNARLFRDRLREIGFYTDLSDAYISQTIHPRYRLEVE